MITDNDWQSWKHRDFTLTQPAQRLPIAFRDGLDARRA